MKHPLKTFKKFSVIPAQAGIQAGFPTCLPAGRLRHSGMTTLQNDFRKNKRGFTLLEILITLLVISVLAVLIVPRVMDRVKKAQEAEAVSNLGAIRSAEILTHQLTGQFVAAADEFGISEALGLLIEGKFYKYKIIDATEENFLALAIPLDALANWLEEIGINKDGFVSYPFSGGGGSSSGSSGGGSGGSSGGGSTWTTTISGAISSSGGGGGCVSYITTYGTGGETIVLPTPPTTNPNMPYPTHVTTTSNNGWLHIGWNSGTTGTYNIVYRATKTDGAIGEFQRLTLPTPNDGWSDQVANGTEYCYQVTSYNPATNEQSEPSSPPACSTASATSAAALAAIEAKNDLEESTRSITQADGVSSGEQLIAWLTAQGIPVLYGRTSCSYVDGGEICTNAYQDPNTNTIVISTDYLNNYPKSAVLLAHEALHQIWDKDYEEYEAGVPGRPQYGTPPTPPGGVRSTNSIDQEYRAHLVQFQIYYDLKTNHGMPADSGYESIWGKFINTETGAPLGSDSEAKIYLNGIYPGLSDY